MAELPVLQITKFAYANVFRNWRVFWRFAWLSMAVYLVADAAAAIYFPGQENENLKEVFITPVYILAVIPVAINWHRRILLGPRFAVKRALDLSLDRRTLPFLWAEIKIGAVLVAFTYLLYNSLSEIYWYSGFAEYIFMSFENTEFLDVISGDDIPSFISSLLTVGVTVIFCFPIVSRLFLIFPAVAVDQDRSFRAAWRLGKGNAFRLAVVLLFASFPFFLMERAFEFADSRFFSQVGTERNWIFPAESILVAAVGALVLFVRTSVIVSALTSSYFFLGASENSEFRNQLRGKGRNRQIPAAPSAP